MRLNFEYSQRQYVHIVRVKNMLLFIFNKKKIFGRLNTEIQYLNSRDFIY